MTPDVQFLLLLAVIALLFITELIPLAVTSIGGAVACGLLGFITPKAVFSGLSNSSVLLFAGMFVVGAAMFHTGLAQNIGKKVVSVFGTSEKSLMLGIMIIGAVLSGFLSNTGTTACLMPVVLGICSAARLPAAAGIRHRFRRHLHYYRYTAEPDRFQRFSRSRLQAFWIF